MRWVMSCAAVIAIVVPAMGQAIVLHPAFVLEQTVRYELSAEMRTTVGDTPSQTLSQRAEVRATPIRHEEGGAVVLRVAFASIEAVKGGERVLWREGEGLAKPEAIEEGGEAEPTAFARVVESLGATPLELEISRTGEIRELRGLGRLVVDARRIGEPTLLESLGALSPTALEETLGLLWEVDVESPANGRSVGDAWSRGRAIDFGGGWRAAINTRLTLASVSAATAVVEGTPRTDLRPPDRELSPTEPRLEVDGETGHTRLTWDVELGQVIERVDERAATWRAVVDGGLLRSEARVESRTHWKRTADTIP